jgi:hypothetical protein
MVGWAMFERGKVQVTGAPQRYQSSDNAIRHFCGVGGTGLFYENRAMFPGMIDIQSATLDDPSLYPPSVHVQWAEALPWMAAAHSLPRVDRYPKD